MTTPYVQPDSIQNPATGGTVTAALLDTYNADHEFHADPPGCVIRLTTTLGISDATVTAVQFNAADARDTDAFHDPASSNTRMTVPTGLGGWYTAGGVVTFAANGTGYRLVGLRVNGTTRMAQQTSVSFGTAANTLTVSAPLLLAAGDYVELIVYQNSGGALNIDGSTIECRAWLLWHGRT